jgi:hypothetical protein
MKTIGDNHDRPLGEGRRAVLMRILGGARVNRDRCCEVAADDSRSKPLAAPTTDGEPRPLTFAKRGLGIASWMFPGASLALLPKCPACLAAYVAMGTGAGISLPAAHLRASLLILCIAWLLYLVARRLCRFVVVKEALLRAKSHRRPTWNSPES